MDNQQLDLDAGNDSIVSEFMLFLREEKKWWLAPLAGMMLGVSTLLVAAQGSALAPFIYTIF